MSLSVLLTNDDGVQAEGLAALREALTVLGAEVHVVAPSRAMSECGHRVTTKDIIPVERMADSIFAVDGTPADCVRLALTRLLPKRPDWVVSGINHGGNLGADIYISGTVAAAREAAFLGVPALAISHYKHRERDFDWAWATRCAARVLQELPPETLSAGEYWNVNLPHVPGSEVPKRVPCPPSVKPLPVRFDAHDPDDEGLRFRYSGVYWSREREPGSDVDVCFGGAIAVSRLRLHGR